LGELPDVGQGQVVAGDGGGSFCEPGFVQGGGYGRYEVLVPARRAHDRRAGRTEELSVSELITCHR
jgi:hypothetical protein